MSTHRHTIPICPGTTFSRREFLRRSIAAAAAAPTVSSSILSHAAETESVSIPRKLTVVDICKRYDYAEIRRVLSVLLDELGDVRSLVKNKFVTVKTNLVNTSKETIGGLPLWFGVTVHPKVALALGSLFVDYGAKRVTYCDQLPFVPIGPESFEGYGFNFDEFSHTMDHKVRFINTRNRGEHKDYALVKVPNPELATAWEVNQEYVKTDVLVSLCKLKSHVSGGVTMGMKNLFGVPPSSMYGDDLKDEPDENATGYRGYTMHECSKKPLTSVTTFNDRSVLNDHGFNVPRFIVDLNAAFPVELVVIDGISVIQSAEGWWNGSMVSVTRPGLLIAGRNPVCTDAVGAAIMGFNPDAADRTHPFANGINHLSLARKKGLGENRIQNLEVGGIGLEKARYEYVPTYQRINT